LLDGAVAAWRELDPALELRAVSVDPKGDRQTLAATLDALELAGASAFVAIDAQFLNFRRLELVQALQERGVAMPALVSPAAAVSAGVEIGDNSWIGPRAILQHGSCVGHNTVVGAGTIVGIGASIGHSSWLDDGVVLGRGTKVGAHVTLGLGVQVTHGVAIADLCVIDRPGRIEKDMGTRTFLHASHDGPIVIVGG
jgi:UDP-3-O-[3-hydroxymyristoyl] glucosamine N-acyltransferase